MIFQRIGCGLSIDTIYPNFKWAIFCAFFVMCTNGTVYAQKSNTVFKVMTYNIWNGFDWGKDLNRKNQFIKWVKNKKPDVLALQELNGYTEEKLKSDAIKWNHSFVKILKKGGYPTGITSNRPITVEERDLDKFWHGLLHCKINGIHFFVVHLSPADSNYRLSEANTIADKIKNNDRKAPYIILGDFNAHSPFDAQYLWNNKKLLDKYTKPVKGKYDNLRFGKFDFSVLSTFLALPSIDLTAGKISSSSNFTFPTPVLVGGEYYKSKSQIQQTRERIDYILAEPKLATSCTKVEVFHDKENEAISDHFPVMATFKLKDHLPNGN